MSTVCYPAAPTLRGRFRNPIQKLVGCPKVEEWTLGKLWEIGLPSLAPEDPVLLNGWPRWGRGGFPGDVPLSWGKQGHHSH